MLGSSSAASRTLAEQRSATRLAASARDAAASLAAASFAAAEVMQQEADTGDLEVSCFILLYNEIITPTLYQVKVLHNKTYALNYKAVPVVPRSCTGSISFSPQTTLLTLLCGFFWASTVLFLSILIQVHCSVECINA